MNKKPEVKNVIMRCGCGTSVQNTPALCSACRRICVDMPSTPSLPSLDGACLRFSLPRMSGM